MEIDSPRHLEPRCKLHLPWQFRQSVSSSLLQRALHIQPLKYSHVPVVEIYFQLRRYVGNMRTHRVMQDSRQPICIKDSDKGTVEEIRFKAWYMKYIFLNPLQSATCPCKESQIEEVSDESKNLAGPRGDLDKHII